jgi:hypothetical protein
MVEYYLVPERKPCINGKTNLTLIVQLNIF